MPDSTHTNPSVDGYLRKHRDWQPHLAALRRIVLDTGLTETIKWRQPCYTLATTNANVVIFGGFKAHCVLSFFKGALLDDPADILEKPGPNTQSARVVRLTTVEQIESLTPTLTAYIEQAIANEKAGLKPALKTIDERAVPEEFQERLDASPELRAAFESLTPGRRRAYLMHFAAPKQSKTRHARIEKALPKIMAGEGLDDAYRKPKK